MLARYELTLWNDYLGTCFATVFGNVYRHIDDPIETPGPRLPWVIRASPCLLTVQMHSLRDHTLGTRLDPDLHR